MKGGTSLEVPPFVSRTAAQWPAASFEADPVGVALAEAASVGVASGVVVLVTAPA